MNPFIAHVHQHLYAIHESRRQPGVSWGKADCWIEVTELAEACDASITSVLTALRKLGDLAEFKEPANWLLDEPAFVRSREV